MIITIIALLVGLVISGGGLYYLAKEKKDEESRKIYLSTTAVGAVIMIGAIIKFML